MTIAPDPFQVRVAQVALSVAGGHGFAHGGGHALLAHGLVARPTEDVDLFTDQEGAVRAASEQIWSTLVNGGFDVTAPADGHELDDAIYGMDDAFEELEISDGSSIVSMSLAQLARRRAPVAMPVGPVLHLDDLLGSKACALATRFEVRDYIDVAAALARGYSRARLLEMANEHDPYLTAEDFASAMRRLDATPDAAFASYGLDAAAVAELRERFASWPRS